MVLCGVAACIVEAAIAKQVKYLNPSEIFKTSRSLYFYKSVMRDTQTHLFTAVGAPTKNLTLKRL